MSELHLKEVTREYRGSELIEEIATPDSKHSSERSVQARIRDREQAFLDGTVFEGVVFERSDAPHRGAVVGYVLSEDGDSSAIYVSWEVEPSLGSRIPARYTLTCIRRIFKGGNHRETVVTPVSMQPTTQSECRRMVKALTLSYLNGSAPDCDRYWFKSSVLGRNDIVTYSTGLSDGECVLLSIYREWVIVEAGVPAGAKA